MDHNKLAYPLADGSTPGPTPVPRAVFDDILYFVMDIWLCGTFIDEMRKKLGRSLSKHLTWKLGAAFAQECRHLPILSYKSGLGWAATAFGPKPVVGFNGRPLPMDDLANAAQYARGFSFELRHVCDPSLFEQVLDVYCRLTPGEIAWLSTYRTTEIARQNFGKDIELWRMHAENILSLKNFLTEDIGRDYRTLVQGEIKDAAADVKVALRKMTLCNKKRTQLKSKLENYGCHNPVAPRIAHTIDDNVEIKPNEFLLAEAKRTWTTLLRLNLSRLGYGEINLRVQSKESRYIELLESVCAEIGLDVKQFTNKLRDLPGISNRETLTCLSRIFEALSVWEPNHPSPVGQTSIKLDRWIYVQASFAQSSVPPHYDRFASDKSEFESGASGKSIAALGTR